MEVTILNSPLFKEYNDKYDEDSLPPLGLGYIATVLEKNGHSVKLIDSIADRIPLMELIDRFNRDKPSVVASNIFTTNYELVKELFEALNFQCHIIIGGLSTKDLYKQILEWETKNPIDIVFGDGELITLDLIEGNVKEDPLDSFDNNRAFKVDSKSRYYVQDISILDLARSHFVNEPVSHPFGFLEANIVASRGCIFNCSFCAAASSMNKDFGIRERSTESIQRELNHISSIYPEVESIRVLDDLFLKRPSCVGRAVDIFSQFEFQWRSMAHVTTFKGVTVEELRKLKSSGCSELFIGIESGSPKILKSINKTSNIESIIQNLSNVLEAGIGIKGYFIFGFPNETAEDMEETFRLAKRLKSIANSFGSDFRTSVFKYRPYHGTEIYHRLKDSGVDTSAVSVEPDSELSDLIGRLQFNLHSGNYSETRDDVTHSYIYRTIELNDPDLFIKGNETKGAAGL